MGAITDPREFLVALAALIGCATLASRIPVVRASAIDPAAAVRRE